MNGIDAAIESILGPLASRLSAVVFFEIPIFGGVPVIVLWLMAAAVFLTVWLRFQPITGIKHSVQVIRGKYSSKTDPGQVSSFQALATELSGTVGLGNIAGVAVAISIGGPGAAVWIAAFGLLAMSMKMAEATLGVMYRTVDEDGTTHGGPMYYLRDGLAQIGWKRTGAVLGVLYAIFALFGVFGAGNLFQANQVAAIAGSFAGEGSFLAQNGWVVGVALAAVTAVVVLGGVTSIARWTSKITPAMAVLYVLSALAIILVNIEQLPAAIGAIVTGAITPSGVAGGAVGVAIVGIQRALFSNGGGIGTAGMSHSASKTKEPATEGFTAMWEPLIDSVVVCSLTAIAITITGVYQGAGADAEGVALTASAFGTVASWFPYLLLVAVILFGFSTLLAYQYYCELSATYLFGNRRSVRTLFRVLWVVAIVIGSAMSLDAVIAFSDSMFFLMAVPNLLGIYFLSRLLRLEILRHKRRVDTGALSAVDAELAVGMGNHDPTPEQVEAAAVLTRTEEMRLEELHRKLAEDPDFPVRAAHHDEALASPMGAPEDPFWERDTDPDAEPAGSARG